MIVFVTKAFVWHLPYYWDEIQWAFGAYWLSEHNLVRAIPGLHPVRTFTFHPPALHIVLASLFKIFGESIWLAHVFIAFIGFLGVHFTYLLGKHLYGTTAGILAALFLFFTPMYFAQSVMFLGDLPVAAFGVIVIYFALTGRYLPYLITGSFFVLIKESALGVVVPLLCYLFITKWRKEDRKTAAVELIRFSVPLAVIGLFFVAQKITTGYFSHLDADLTPKTMTWDVLFSEFKRITSWLFYYQFRILFVALILLNFLLFRKFLARKELLLFLLILICSGLVYTFISFLPRYILPVLPFLCLTASWSLTELIHNRTLQSLTGVMITALLVSTLSGGISFGTSEWNMKYVDAVNGQKQMTQYLQQKHSNEKILTARPQRNYLLYPYAGFVDAPLRVVPFIGEKESFGQADLILISEAPGNRFDYQLRDYAKQKQLPLIKRIQEGNFLSELYSLK